MEFQQVSSDIPPETPDWILPGIPALQEFLLGCLQVFVIFLKSYFFVIYSLNSRYDPSRNFRNCDGNSSGSYIRNIFLRGYAQLSLKQFLQQFIRKFLQQFFFVVFPRKLCGFFTSWCSYSLYHMELNLIALLPSLILSLKALFHWGLHVKNKQNT